VRRKIDPDVDVSVALGPIDPAAPDGCTEALMFANGFTAELLIELVRAGLASAHAERMVAGGKDDGGRESHMPSQAVRSPFGTWKRASASRGGIVEVE
jgi:hypothetical protein